MKQEKTLYRPGLLRDTDKELVESLSSERKLGLTIDGYDKTANDWDKTRQNFWPELILEINKYIIQNVNNSDNKDNYKLLDLGCGNGRLIPEIEELKKQNYNIGYLGMDPSKELIKIAMNKYPKKELITFDGFSLNNKLNPNNVNIEDGSFDQVISIAVLHHIPPEKVVNWLSEANRVTKRNTVSIYTTWNLLESNYELNQNKDAVIGFMNHKNTRYVHHYGYKERNDIFTKSGYKILELKEIKRESGMSNTVIIVKN
jgi:ubiquinone/menaquinone biosynthesis C-methylase UbiE